MGLFTRGGKRPPKLADRSELLAATLRPAETILRRFAYSNPSDHLTARASGHAYHAASLNARNMAAKGFTLYRKADAVSVGQDRYGNGITDYPAKGVSKKARQRVKFYKKGAQYGRASDELVEVTDHPALDLLNDGNPWDCGLGILELFCFFFDLTGNGYIHPIMGESGAPVELWPLAAQHVTIVGDTEDYIDGFAYSRNKHEHAYFEAHEVLHAKQPNPFHPLYGMSWLEASLMDADIDQAQRQQILSGYLNNSAPSMLAVIKGAVGSRVQEFVDRWESRHRGPQNAGKLAAISADATGGMDIHEFGTTPEALQLIDHLGWQRDLIMSRAGIPKALYTSDDVNLANAEMAELFYERRTIVPKMLYIAAMLTERYLPLFGVAPGEMFFGVEETDATDVKAESERVNTLVSGGIITPNEARRELGYEDVEGGDELREQADPLGDPFGFGFSPGSHREVADEALTGVQIDAMVSLATELAHGNLPRDAVREMMLASFPGVPEERVDAIIVSIDGFTPPSPSPEPEEPQDAKAVTQEPEVIDRAPGLALSIDHKSLLFEDADCGCDSSFSAPEPDTDALRVLAEHRYAGTVSAKTETPRDPESQFTGALAEFFAKQAEAIVARVKSDPSNFSIGSLVAPKSYVETINKNTEARWNAALADLIEKYTTPEFIDAGAEALAEVAGNLEGAFDLADERAVRFFDRYRTQLARTSAAINSATETAVSKMIQEGILNGLSSVDLAGEIESRLAEIGPSRALRIARSETSRARGAAVEAGWAQSDVVTGKRWLAAPNECEFCERVDGATAELGEPFYKRGDTVTGARGGTLKLNFEDIHHHPLHPNCRCAVVAVRGDDE